MKRGRNQRRRPGGGNSNPNRALDSNGPEVRIRGTATQIYDKYTALARDASSSGDRIKAESYLQHAEHYFRVIRATQPPQQQQQGQQSGQSQPNQSGQSQPSSREGEGEQPTIEGGEDAPKGRQNNRRRQEAKPSAEAPAETTSETEAPAKSEPGGDAEETVKASEVEAEKKPKRRRAPRRTKAAAAEGDAAKTDSKTAPATAAE